ncbi:aldehyde dehydrogenase [Cryphonectria parasitica EP155]|uniref:Aldehyde dehydrogenase n=1 Tax=Cryphonectria parasitica (strain ATCC 38755 / EP155) TaxID=660469 RepID=A0A9P5CIQ8_CRYP1|nr:aldehyde dehydrogenase [Cryphonectria parasitica EP155]KAF3760879.1 aldehyde dehydrogenase [Cryphonectria parasitica EP155]
MASKSASQRGSAVSIPAFAATPVETISEMCATVRNTYRTLRTKDLEYRKVQLRKLYWAIMDRASQIEEAMLRDLRKSQYETDLTEIDWLTNTIIFTIENLDKWAQDEYPSVPFHHRPNNIRVRREPMGAVLVIGTYNFPLMLSLEPLVGAIAAGCTAVVKPSEGAPNVAAVIGEIVEAALDPSAYRVVNGAVQETTALLDQKWDKIFYTGSAQIARIISKKAAESLTPVALELGGRNPAFVTRNADLKIAARRLLWGKTLCAGQVCMSQNYVLVEREVVDDFIKGLTAAFRDFFPNGPKESPDLARVVNERHFLRMKNMLDETKGRIVMGGQMDQSDLFIAPTAVLVNSVEDSMMVQESFGPLFSIMPFDTLGQAIEIANSIDPTPLSLFGFGTKDEFNKLINAVTSGGATYNDSYMHGSVANVPFGGVGESGSGAYRGKASFDTFTHFRTLADTPSWAEGGLRIRYQPYDWSQLRLMRWMSQKKPNFDRDGKVTRGAGYWLKFVLGLGTANKKSALLRWVVAALTWYYYVNVRKG